MNETNSPISIPMVAELNSILRPNAPLGPVRIFMAAGTQEAAGGLAPPPSSISQLQELSSTGGAGLTHYTFEGRTDLARLPVADETTYQLSFFGILTSFTDHLSVVPANNLVSRMVALSRGLYDKTLSRCREILSSVDLEDESSKGSASERIRDLFAVMSELAEPLFCDLLAEINADSNLVGFVLTEVLAEVDEIQGEIKVRILSNLINSPRSSIRYEAVRALDILNGSAARFALEALRSHETNREVKSLLDASIR